MPKRIRKHVVRKTVLRLPDLDHAKTSVLNSLSSPNRQRAAALLEECIGLLTGQSVPIFRCGRKRRFNADRHALNDQ